MDSTTTIRLSSPLTHSDWVMHTNESVPMGPEGVRYMLDHCKESGWSRIYWRTRNGGLAVYHSGVMDLEGKLDEDNYFNPQTPEDKALTDDINKASGLGEQEAAETLARLESLDYNDFDSLAEAVKYGHEIGIEVHAWISINEEDHAWGASSRYVKAHPEYRWKRRDGSFYHSQLSFAYREANEYRLEMIRETIENYDVDGVFLDWIRTGDTRDNPQNDPEGVADYGYETPLVEGFKAEYGIDPHDLSNGDPRWVKYRAEPQTEFMRSARKLMKSTKPDLPLAVMVNHPWSKRNRYWIDGNLRGMLLDVRTWAREGLMDEVVAAGYYMPGGTPESAYRALQEETEGRVDVWLFVWVPEKVSDFERDVQLAEKLGAKQLLFWEADYITCRGNKEDLQRVMRERFTH